MSSPTTRERSTQVLVRLAPDQAARLREEARRDGRPVANLARRLIERGLCDREGDRE